MADITQILNQRMSRYERERARLVEEYVTAAWKMWQSLSPADWWNDAITQGASANLTSRYMAFVERMRRLGIAYADIALGLVGATAQGQLPEFEVVRDNTDPWKMMLRPVESYRDASSKEPHLRPSAWENLEADAQRSVDRWLEEANERLIDIIDTDSMIAGTHATLERYRKSGVTRYRRIIHPELSKTGTCGLCVVAADRVYSIAALMPLHGNCHCTVLPIVGDNDPGLRLNDDDLKRIYKEAGGTASAKLRQTRRADPHQQRDRPRIERQGSQATQGRGMASARRGYDTGADSTNVGESQRVHRILPEGRIDRKGRTLPLRGAHLPFRTFAAPETGAGVKPCVRATTQGEASPCRVTATKLKGTIPDG